jgi:signal transduction histidine kinase
MLRTILRRSLPRDSRFCTAKCIYECGISVRYLQSLPDHNKGFGLFSIKERLQWYGGDMAVPSAPGRGTQVTLFAPVRQ